MCPQILLSPTLSDPMGYSPQGSSVPGNFAVKKNGVGCHSYSRESLQPWGGAHIPYIFCIGRRILYTAPPGKPINMATSFLKLLKG